MANFNFLSGSSIDTIPNMLFDVLEAEECYLGFAKGSPKNQWGVSATVQIEHTAADYNNAIAKSGQTESKFYDLNSVLVTNALDTKRQITIKRYDVNDTTFAIPYTFTDDVIGNLTLSYINRSWAVIQGLRYNYYDLMPLKSADGATSYVYYIENWDNTGSVRLKIKTKVFNSIPFYSTKCELFMSTGGGAYTKVATNLEKNSNILGETFVSGLPDPDSSLTGLFDVSTDQGEANKTILIGSTFKLVNLNGETLIPNLTFVDPEELSPQIYTTVSSYETPQKYISFSYSYVDGMPQVLKLIVGSNQVDALAIWQEALPFGTSNPVADANPPGLDISYLKSPAIHTSIFDVNGYTKIKKSDLKFIKEIQTTTELQALGAAGFTIENIILEGEEVTHVGIVQTPISAIATGSTSIRTIQLHNTHTFVIGDVIPIPISPITQTFPTTSYTVEFVTMDTVTFTSDIHISEDLLANVVLTALPSNVNANIKLATTTDKEKALSYGFSNVLISKTVPKTGVLSPTENIYRQLFIAYRPLNSNGTTYTKTPINSDDVHNGDLTLCGVNFNQATWKYDNGLIVYISNKLPVYRKWATVDEQFKIIL
jgi:hypothetical protein